jgi:Tol biopolymer transport system component
LLAIVGVAVSLFPGAAPAAGQPAPDSDWRTLHTEHFRILFPAELEAFARRAADRGERAYADLSVALLEPNPGPIDMVLADNVDYSNGLAGMSPWRRILIYAPPPTDEFGLRYFDDWLELVIVHELVHIFHLDHQGGLSRIARGLVGRFPAGWPVFPQGTVPKWTVEGLATWYESALTGAGRAKGTDHEMVVRVARQAGALEDLGQAGGDSPVWPGGNRYYIYGSRFLDDMVERHGQEGLAGFVEAISDQWVPFRINAASREAFGQGFSEAWRQWLLEHDEGGPVGVAASGAEGRALPGEDDLEILTQGGWDQTNPRIRPSGVVVYARADRRSDPQLTEILVDGSERKLIRTNGLASFELIPDGGVLLSQVEYRDPYRLHGDLYVLDPAGKTRRLTRGARLSQPTVHPDGTQAVVVQEGRGTNRLVSVDLRSGEISVLRDFDPDVHWAGPSWSPDGTRLAVSRWRTGAWFDVVLLASDGALQAEVTRDRAVDVSPAWSPDGRFVVWASDRSGISNLYARSVGPDGSLGPLRQLTDVAGGLDAPQVDPEGRWIYASLYRADGWSIARLPFDPDSWGEPGPEDPRFAAGERGDVDMLEGPARESGSVQPYSPWRSLLPRYWGPVYGPGETSSEGYEQLGWGVGAFSAGQDLVGRHAWSASVLWRPAGNRFDGSLAYEYAGLGTPILGISGQQDWDGAGPFGFVMGNDTIPVILQERERSTNLYATLPRVRARSYVAASLGAGLVRTSIFLEDLAGEAIPESELTRPHRTSGQVFLTGSFSTTRSHPFSVSREDGVAGFVRVRARRDLDVADSLSAEPGWDDGFDEITGRVAGYWGVGGPGFASHVLAARVSFGYASGPGADAFHFDLGGASGQSLPGPISIGSGSILFPLRGYTSGYRSGRAALSGSLEYRFPLGILHKGLGAFPLHLDRLMGDLFVDVGNAWGPELEVPGYYNPRQETLVSTGAELRLRFTPFWAGALDLRAGVAVPLVEAEGASFYLRLGPSF